MPRPRHVVVRGQAMVSASVPVDWALLIVAPEGPRWCRRCVGEFHESISTGQCDWPGKPPVVGRSQ